MYLGAAVLAAFFSERTGEAKMKILTRGIHRAMRTRAVFAVHPRAVAFTTE